MFISCMDHSKAEYPGQCDPVAVWVAPPQMGLTSCPPSSPPEQPNFTISSNPLEAPTWFSQLLQHVQKSSSVSTPPPQRLTKQM